MFKQIGLFTLSILKLDPVKTALYQLAKYSVIYGTKAISKSTKNQVDDKMAKALEAALKNNI